MQLTVHGNRNLIARELLEIDTPQLVEFCKECEKLGWENNKDLKAIKLDKMQLPYGKFFVALDGEKIVSIAGIHKFPEINDNAYRCLFRGAQLPKYTPAFSMNMFNSGVQFTYLLYQQIMLVTSLNLNAEFYITTNVDNVNAGASSRLNKIMMPRLEKQGFWELHQSNMMIYNTRQNVWKIHVDHYLREREKFLSSISNT
jgi:hypothetical protein